MLWLHMETIGWNQFWSTLCKKKNQFQAQGISINFLETQMGKIAYALNSRTIRALSISI